MDSNLLIALFFIFVGGGAAIGWVRGRLAVGILLGWLLGPIGWAIVWFGPNKVLRCPACGTRLNPGFPTCPGCRAEVPKTSAPRA